MGKTCGKMAVVNSKAPWAKGPHLPNIDSSKGFVPRPRRHSTPKKHGKLTELDSTQYLTLNIDDRRDSRFEKPCTKCLFRGSDVNEYLTQLEIVKAYLDRDGEHLAKTRKSLTRMCKSHENLKEKLSEHQEDIKKMNLHLSNVTSNLNGFIQKEELFLTYLASQK